MTLALPILAPDLSNLQFILDLIAQGALDTGGRSVAIRHGNVTMTWTAATSAAAQTVTHGLPSGRTPTNVQLTPRSVGFGPAGEVIVCKATARGATTFTVNAESNNVVTGSVVVDWFAVG
jgi:hypothetical protein